MMPPQEGLTVKQLTQQNLRDLSACFRNCDRAVVILKGRRRVRWMTEPARKCMAEYFGDLPPQTNRLPRPLEQWIERQNRGRNNRRSAASKSTVIERNGEQLVLRLVNDQQERVSLLRLENQQPVLSSRSLERLGLSRREAEVLRCLARGMTNAEIGTTLGLSRFTVRTHLENIYEKLGVKTRTAAAALAYKEHLKPGIGELGSS